MWRKMADLGWMGIAFPDEYGGTDGDFIDLMIILEGMGRYVCPSPFFSTVVLGGLTILAAGTEDQKRNLLPKIADGEMILTMALTEPDSRYTASSLRVKAERDKGEYIINGQKSAFISNGPIATHALLILCLDKPQGMRGTGIALLPLDLPGVSRGKPLDKLGLRSYSQGALIFDEVAIPEKWMLISDPQQGFETQQWILTPACELLSAVNTGLAQAAYDEALKYAQTRIQGGKPIIAHQSINLKLFKMLTMIESARSYSRRMALHNAANPPGSAMHALSSKVCCTETAFTVASEAMQIFGGYGLSKEYPIEKIFRDAWTGLIGEENNALSLAGASFLSEWS